jgi:hypothetical protein
MGVSSEDLSKGLEVINSTDLLGTSSSSTSNQDNDDHPFTWHQSLDLSYKPNPPMLYPLADLAALPSTSDELMPYAIPAQCFSCAAPDPASLCPQCKVARYCNKECYKQDWKCKAGGGYHKMNCESYALLGKANVFPTSKNKMAAVETGVVNRVRMYMCPIAVYNYDQKGAGFIYLQSPHPLTAFQFPSPGVRDTFGPVHPSRVSSRTVILNYVTLGEFPSLTSDDFEITQTLETITKCCQTVNFQEEVLVLCKFRCGFVGVFSVKIVLGYKACLMLGQDYKNQETFQLNIDDV